MPNRIQISDGTEKEVPDPLDDPRERERPRSADEVAPVPETERLEHDYEDEVPSQRRLRWMTQVLVVPLFVLGLWGFSAMGAYMISLLRCPGGASSLRPYAGASLALGALATGLWFAARGKLGLRRWWLNAIVIVAMVALGVRYGWSAPSYSLCGWIGP